MKCGKTSFLEEGELHFAYGHIDDNELSNSFHYGKSTHQKNGLGRDDNVTFL